MTAYYRRGKTQIWYVATLSSTTSPPITGINAGTELSESVADIAGFSFKNNPIDTPVLSSSWTNKIPGPDTADDSSITFYDDDTANPLRTTLAKGTVGFIVILPAGNGSGDITAAQKVDVFPIVVAGTPREYTLGNDPAKWSAECTISSPPSIDATTV